MRWITAVLLLTAVSYSSPAASSGEKSDFRALEAVFDSDLTNVMELRRRLSSWPASRQFEELAAAVLPHQSDQIRIGIDFTPTSLAPGAAAELGVTPGWRQAAIRLAHDSYGGELISNAIDLVNVARDCGKLDDLKQRILARDASEPASKARRSALLALMAMATDDESAAEDQINQLYELVAAGPVDSVDRESAAVVIWFGAQQANTRQLVRDLAYLVYERARSEVQPHTERWLRQTYSLKYLLQWLSQEESPSTHNSLSRWHPVSRMTARTSGQGFPVARWQTTPGAVHHVTSHDDDYLYYAIPVMGNFDVEADLTTFDYRDIHLAAGGVWAGPGYDLKACLNGDFRRHFPAIPIKPPLSRVFKSMRVRIEVRDGQRMTYVSGRKVFQSPHPPDADPWIAIHSPWYTNGTVRNLRVTAETPVPQEISLTMLASLPGWLPYFDESIGKSDSVWRLVREDVPLSANQSNGKPHSATSRRSRVLVGRKRWVPRGSFCESLLRYHRPMLEDGQISYEFFYEPGKSQVHPALDRLAFLLVGDGVKIHWITDGAYDRTGINPNNQSVEPANRRGPQQLPLLAADWNHLTLKLSGDNVQLILNGQLVYERELETTNSRAFGFFHFADISEARIRNVRWRGSWPSQLPDPLEQELADDAVEQLVGDREQLGAVFDHDFATGLPLNKFQVWGQDWRDHFQQTKSGVRFERKGVANRYVQYFVVPQLQLIGDFDVVADFENFSASAVNGGSGNVHLNVGIDNDLTTDCRLIRTFSKWGDPKGQHLVQAAFFEHPDGRTELSFPVSPAAEATAGRLRMARRGDQVHYLYATHDSENFQLLYSKNVGRGSTLRNSLRLVNETYKENGHSTVVWKKVSIRAEALSGPAMRNSAETMSPLVVPAERAESPASVRQRFFSGLKSLLTGEDKD